MDTECQRRGYDDTGRYHVPEVPAVPLVAHKTPTPSTPPGWDAVLDTAYDGCADCGDSCNSPVSQTVNAPSEGNIPYPVQEFMFESLATTAFLQIEDLLERHEDTIIAMARERFREGYKKFGSEMYQWSAEARLLNVLEELADAVVYLTSGPIK